MSRIISIAQELVKNRYFNYTVFVLILLSAIIIGIETYPGLAEEYRPVLRFIDQFIIACFTLEIAIKILANGNNPRNFFADPWNLFDFVIVAVCLYPFNDTHFFAVFRILRVLRILRMITFFPKLRLIIGALLKSIPSMGYVVLLIAILFYLYAVIGVFYFGETDPVHFGDLHHAMVTLFKILTLEGWTDIMNTHIYGNANNGLQEIISFWPFFYFASFILIGAMIIMNLFIGVIMNSMEESQKELSRELKSIHYRGKNTSELYMQIISKLEDLNSEIRSLKNNS